MANIPNKAPNVITASGTITPAAYNPINAAGALALTLPAATIDGQDCVFLDETGHAHVITCTNGLNGGTNSTLTFGGAKADSVHIYSRNGFWWVPVGELGGVTVA